MKCHHPSLPLRAPGRKAERTGPFQGEEGGRKIEQDPFMIELCVREDFPVSRTGLDRLKGASAQTESLLHLSSGLSVGPSVRFMSRKATRFSFLTLRDT